MHHLSLTTRCPSLHRYIPSQLHRPATFKPPDGFTTIWNHTLRLIKSCGWSLYRILSNYGNSFGQLNNNRPLFIIKVTFWQLCYIPLYCLHLIPITHLKYIFKKTTFSICEISVKWNNRHQCVCIRLFTRSGKICEEQSARWSYDKFNILISYTPLLFGYILLQLVTFSYPTEKHWTCVFTNKWCNVPKESFKE